MWGRGVWAATGVPLGLPGIPGEPADGADHGGDGVGHVGEVDGGEIVRDVVVVLVQAEAGDGVCDDALTGESDVVGALEELLLGVWIVDQVCTMFGEFRAEVGALVAGEPEGSGRDGGIGAADHLKFQVGDDAGEWCRRMREEGACAESANLF